MPQLTVLKLLICSKIQYTGVYLKMGDYVGVVTDLGPGADYTGECGLSVEQEEYSEFSLQLWEYEGQKCLNSWIFRTKEINSDGYRLVQEDKNFKIYFQIICKKPKKKQILYCLSKKNQENLHSPSHPYLALQKSIQNNISRKIPQLKSHNQRLHPIFDAQTFWELQASTSVQHDKNARYYSQPQIIYGMFERVA